MIVDWCEPAVAAGVQLQIEQDVFESMPGAVPRLRIWQPLPALVVTTAEASHAAFGAAASRAAARGVPVAVRRSGGGAVCLGPGMLVVSHFHTSMHDDIDASYRSFARRLMAAVQVVGVVLTEEHVARAYCDGKFDLAWCGLKVGGMAQRRRSRDGASHVWIHAVIAVEPESLRYPEEVAQFYSDSSMPRIADPSRTTCLSLCMPSESRAPGLLRRCGDVIAGSFRAESS